MYAYKNLRGNWCVYLYVEGLFAPLYVIDDGEIILEWIDNALTA